MNQWFLFMGDNTYERDRESKRWICAFGQKYGLENITVFDTPSLSIPSLHDELAAAPFIAEKRLIVLNGLPRVEKSDISALLASTHPSSLVLCVEESPDRRLSSTKGFLAQLDVRTFPRKTRQEILLWLQTLAEEFGVTLASVEANELLARIGEDQYMLASELRKIATYAGKGARIERSHIDELVLFQADRAVWQLLDLVSTGMQKEAFSLVRNLLQKGENPHGLWSKMLWMVAQVMLVSAAADSGLSQPGAIAKEAGVSFPTAKSLFPFVRSLHHDELRITCAWFAEADRYLKIGAYRSTADAPEELTTLIDRGVLNLLALAKH